MTDDQDVTLGELYRLTLAQNRTLEDIRSDVRAQNGRVGTLEREVAVIKDRGEQTKDLHARGVGWSGVGVAAAALWWSIFHK